jgi:SAM-dependent methyltransferase
MQTNHCPVCNSADINVFAEITGMPVYCNRLWPTREGAVKAPKGDIYLGYCSHCGHVFNTAFDPSLMDYDQEYDNSLHYSSRFQRYAEALARRLVKDYDLYEKDVIEIGCGKGDFLAMLCEFGKNRGLGFDPSYEADREPEKKSNRFRVIQDYYAEPYHDHTADLICCRHVLEHIQYPSEFLKSVRKTIGDQSQVIVFFEVPDVMYTLNDMGVWDLIYEHCGYFTRKSLDYAFNTSGFKTLKIETVFEGQFLCIDAKPAGNGNRLADYLDHRGNPYGRLITEFSQKYHSKKKHWSEELDRMATAGKKGVIWGGGSKGVTFSNALKASDLLGYVVDINPHKQGKFVPGTGQEIVSPEFLKEYRPDVILVMNPNYLSEIKRQVNSLNLKATFFGV